MREAQSMESAVGMDWYLSDHPGIGGRLRREPDDFRVRELEGIDPEPVDADADAYSYLVVRATLRNWDTNEFARELSNHLGISRGRIQWAGTKDRRAVTTQLFSLKGVDPEELPPIKEADLEIVGRYGRALSFGDLAGNDFQITVRDVDDPDGVAPITADLQSVTPADGDDRIGVPNYFGHQRFGSHRPITHTVGLAILDRDWEGAVMTYLAETGAAEPDDTRAARQAVGDDRDWAAALEAFPNRLRFERSMLHVLADDGGFQAALTALPENLQQMFVHAAQSYLFNRIVSERLERGLPLGTPVVGDVVCFVTDHGHLTVPDTDRLQTVTEQRVSVVERHCRRGRAYVTAPLIGTDTSFGEGEPAEIARSVLDDEGLSTDDFALPEPYQSAGTRRPILLDTALESRVGADTVEMSFALPKGAYATVVLREYLKTDPTSL